MATEVDILPEPFPARTKITSGTVNGVHTDVMSVNFADKILITISQGGRLAHWIHVPLDSATADPTAAPPISYDEDDEAESSDLLPMAHLTATTVLGNTGSQRDTVGQLYATQIASAIATKNPEEKRLVVVGLGVEKAEADRAAFMDMVELAMSVI